MKEICDKKIFSPYPPRSPPRAFKVDKSGFWKDSNQCQLCGDDASLLLLPYETSLSLLELPRGCFDG